MNQYGKAQTLLAQVLGLDGPPAPLSVPRS